MENVQGLHDLASASNGISRAGADFLIGSVGESRQRMAKAVEEGEAPSWILDTFDSLNGMYVKAIKEMHREE